MNHALSRRNLLKASAAGAAATGLAACSGSTTGPADSSSPSVAAPATRTADFELLDVSLSAEDLRQGFTLRRRQCCAGDADPCLQPHVTINVHASGHSGEPQAQAH